MRRQKMKQLRSMEKFVDGLAQDSEGDRFSQHRINGAWSRVGGVDESAEAGQHDNWQAGMQSFNQFSGLIAAHLRHGSIEKNDVEPFSLRLSNGLTSAGCHCDRVAVAAQILGNDLADSLVVIDNENVEIRFSSVGGLLCWWTYFYEVSNR